jgi:Flp pilus assembly CpaE family ATPase
MKAAIYVADDPRRINRAANEGLLIHEVAPRCSVSRQLLKLAKMVAG